MGDFSSAATARSCQHFNGAVVKYSAPLGVAVPTPAQGYLDHARRSSSDLRVTAKPRSPTPFVVRESPGQSSSRKRD